VCVCVCVYVCVYEKRGETSHIYASIYRVAKTHRMPQVAGHFSQISH